MELMGEMKEWKDEEKELKDDVKEVKYVVFSIWELLSKQQTPLQHPASTVPQSLCQTPPPLSSPLQPAQLSL